MYMIVTLGVEKNTLIKQTSKKKSTKPKGQV